MKRLLFVALLLATGCFAGCKAPNMMIVGTASFESDQPDGKAIARVQVNYVPGMMPSPLPIKPFEVQPNEPIAQRQDAQRQNHMPR